jgi:hypothetical protein
MKKDAELRKWCKVLTDSAPQNLDEVPDGWYSSFQLSKLLRKPWSTVRYTLRERGGQLEQRMFRVTCGRQVRNVLHYKLKEDEKSAL